MILNDAPELLTGLARIGRDIASLLSMMPEFRVAYLGMGGFGRRKFMWQSYSFPESTSFGAEAIAPAWLDFSGPDDGIILSLWDASRMLWFADPRGMSADMQEFLGPGRTFAKWGYFPVDSVGIHDNQLPLGMQAAVSGYDRVIGASEWGGNLLRQVKPRADWMPHGVWMNIFELLPNARALLDWRAASIYLGCNMTNQARKDWPAAFHTAALLKQVYGSRLRFWAHTDRMLHYWNLYALATEYGVGDIIEVTMDLNDRQLALRYSACDVTILPSSGEGFGYPIAESLACGTACVVTDYAAGQELVAEECRVPVTAWKIDTAHNVRRAVISGHGFARLAHAQIEAKRADPEYRSDELRSTVEHLDWNSLKHPWMRWFRDGLREYA